MTATAYIVPSADVANSATSWARTPAATFWQNVAEAGVADDSNYNQAGNDGWFECSCTSMPKALYVVGLTVLMRVRLDGPATAQLARVYLRIGGTQYNGAWHSIVGATSETNFTHYWAVNPATGLPWTPPELNIIVIGWEYFDSLSESARITQLRGEIVYAPLPPDQEASRDAASRKLYLRRTPSQLPKITGGLWLLDLAHHTQVDLHHILGVSESALGWEPTTWKRGMMGVREVSVDPMSNTVTLTLRNERRIRCLLYDSGWARQGGPTKNGLMKFSNGAIWTFTRASSATFTDASGESVTVQADVEAYRDAGQEFLAAAGGRAQDRGYWSNHSAGRTFCAARNSMRFEVTPDWNAAAVTTLNLTVAYIYHDANNNAWLYFDGANARWVLALRVAGSTYLATKAHSPVAGTRYIIGARVTGSHGELGLTPFTASIFVDGVKGTDVVAGAAMTEAASSTFDIGTKAGTDPFRGCIRRRISRQIVLTDIEMARSFS